MAYQQLVTHPAPLTWFSIELTAASDTSASLQLGKAPQQFS
jgi:hypothetical protein